MPSVPRYRIQAVADLTGIPAATLRAWERRYGVPEPSRTQARYRLYSEHDVAVVRRMASLCAAGVRPAEAAQLAVSEGRVPELAPAQGADLVQRILGAVRALDGEGLRAALDLALENAPARGFDSVLSPALAQIGCLWEKGEISVAEEHAGSQIIRQVMLARLRLMMPPSPAPRVLLACIDEEQHELGLLGLGLHLATWGYRPLFLGARVPPKAVADGIARERPALVALSVVVEPTEDTRTLFAAYGKACGAVPWIVGGPGAASLSEPVRRRGGHLAPLDIEELQRLVRSLTGSVAPA
ncbi:MAG: MerR family transcriptional regulator [Myxococcales bacterium]|nr:MerR family transcriptional regulator [Myxococcales bacterium]